MAQQTWTNGQLVDEAAMTQLEYRIRALESGGGPIYRNTNGSTIGLVTATFTVCPFGSSPDIDTGGGWASANPTRYTAQVAGWYNVLGSAAIGSVGVHRAIAQIYKNGVAYSTRNTSSNAGTGTGVEGDVQVAHFVSMAVGDYVELYAYQDSGSSSTIATGSAVLELAWFAPNS